ncbi:MAG: TlpA disulfide reductase family protein [Elusimicrobiota bacterium]
MRFRILSTAVIIAALCAGFSNSHAARLALDFELSDVNGKTVTLNSLKGNVVFLDFWASWCPPCRNSIPAVESLYQELKDEKVVFIGINIENKPALARNFAINNGINYTILMGDQKTTRAYGVRGIPAFFLIDHQGNVVKTYVGFQDGLKETWKSDIQELLLKIQEEKPNPAKKPSPRKK